MLNIIKYIVKNSYFVNFNLKNEFFRNWNIYNYNFDVSFTK